MRSPVKGPKSRNVANVAVKTRPPPLRLVQSQRPAHQEAAMHPGPGGGCGAGGCGGGGCGGGGCGGGGPLAAPRRSLGSVRPPMPSATPMAAAARQPARRQGTTLAVDAVMIVRQACAIGGSDAGQYPRAGGKGCFCSTLRAARHACEKIRWVGRTIPVAGSFRRLLPLCAGD
jgi:hypothetical protein